MSYRSSAVLLLWALVSIQSTEAGPYCQQQELRPADLGPDDKFGFPLALDSDTLVIGAQGEWIPAAGRRGAAYVYRLVGSSWVEEQKLELPEPPTPGDDTFGWSLDIDGDVIAVAAPWNNSVAGSAGAVFVYRRVGGVWVLEQKLVASNGGFDEWLGYRVAVDGNVIAASSRHNSGAGFWSGTVYLFRFDGTMWVEEQTLSKSSYDYKHFGRAISFRDNRLVVGSQYNPQFPLLDLGAAFAYRHNGNSWVVELSMHLNEVAPIDFQFGQGVFTDGDTIVIGSPGTPTTGAAYIYEYDGLHWLFEQKIEATGVGAPGKISSGPTDGDTLVLGTPWDSAVGDRAGAAHVFTRSGTTWTQQQRLVAHGAAPLDHFGGAIVLGNGFAIVGVQSRDAVGVDSGEVIVFTLGGSDCNENLLCDDHYLETDCDVSGVPDDCENDCNENGLEDSCDIAAGAPDSNENGVPDECEVPRNRYLSVVTFQPALPTAFEVKIRPIPYVIGQEVPVGWMGEPNRDGIATIASTPFYSDRWPRLVYLRGCAVMPARDYTISSTLDGTVFSQPSLVRSVDRPSPKHWGDTAGSLVDGVWTEPNGVANINDVIASLHRIQNGSASLHLTRVDVLAISSTDPCVNGIVNTADVLMLVKAVQGNVYPFTTDTSLCSICP